MRLQSVTPLLSYIKFSLHLPLSARVLNKRTCHSTFAQLIRNAHVECRNLPMEPFSKLILKSDLPIWIKPLDPHDFPNQNEMIINVWTRDDQCEDMDDMYKLSLESSDNMKESGDNTTECGDKTTDVHCTLHSSLSCEESPLFCDIQLPLNADIDAVMNNNLHASKMESDHVKLTMRRGNCRLDRMKTSRVDIDSDEGDVTSSKVLHGDVTVHIKNGNFHADRVQGQTVIITNDNGHINLKTLYAVTALMTSRSGDVTIAACHGESTIKQESGNLCIGSLDGDLKSEVQSGNMDVHITRHYSLDLTAHSGDINMTTDEPNPTQVDFCARNVHIADEMNLIDQKTESHEEATCITGVLRSSSDSKIMCTARQGNISLKFKDWLSTLKLS